MFNIVRQVSYENKILIIGVMTVMSIQSFSWTIVAFQFNIEFLVCFQQRKASHAHVTPDVSKGTKEERVIADFLGM